MKEKQGSYVPKLEEGERELSRWEKEAREAEIDSSERSGQTRLKIMLNNFQ